MIGKLDVVDENALDPEQSGLAGGVGGVGAPSLVMHMLRFCSQLRLVRASSTFEDAEEAVMAAGEDEDTDEDEEDDEGDDERLSLSLAVLINMFNSTSSNSPLLLVLLYVPTDCSEHIKGADEEAGTTTVSDIGKLCVTILRVLLVTSISLPVVQSNHQFTTLTALSILINLPINNVRSCFNIQFNHLFFALCLSP